MVLHVVVVVPIVFDTVTPVVVPATKTRVLTVKEAQVVSQARVLGVNIEGNALVAAEPVAVQVPAAQPGLDVQAMPVVGVMTPQ